MGDGALIRALVALVFAGLLWAQARAVRGQPRRRRAFELAAGALLLLAALQFSLGAGVTFAPLLYLSAAGALALLVAAIGALVASWRGGEMRGQSDKIAAAAKEYREKRTRNDER